MIRIAAWLLAALLLPVQAFAANKILWSLAEHQPDTLGGGRAGSVAVHPSNGDRLLAATETGGLFKSSDGGETWTHVDAVPSFTQDVAFVEDQQAPEETEPDPNAVPEEPEDPDEVNPDEASAKDETDTSTTSVAVPG